MSNAGPRRRALQRLAAFIACLPVAAAAAEIRDCAGCPAMVAIPAGHFIMGAAPGEEEREALGTAFRHRSAPQRRVAVAGFLAAKLEVTRGEYRAFAQATARGATGCFTWKATAFELDPARGWSDSGYPQDDTHPATCLSWEDASAYADWLGRRTGKRYRLLTEAEWEYAARAGTRGARYWGDDPRRACEYANGADYATAARAPQAGATYNADCDDGHAHTAPAGSDRANAIGLHDMLGNVEEWTADCWNANHQGAPADASARVSGDCALRAVRGGAWDDAPAGVRAAYRVGSPVTVRVYRRGFRVARDL